MSSCGGGFIDGDWATFIGDKCGQFELAMESSPIIELELT